MYWIWLVLFLMANLMSKLIWSRRSFSNLLSLTTLVKMSARLPTLPCTTWSLNCFFLGMEFEGQEEVQVLVDNELLLSWWKEVQDVVALALVGLQLHTWLY